ncbi:pro-resilin-like [Ruditapes philippinarum]|uniref:pro-resilin-like n=1 Tax=Ruditapes philippinarum TaxID=129788 RepID=UPI00295B621A|nr:pro-resilin-like [Ruditapes philippinarum]
MAIFLQWILVRYVFVYSFHREQRPFYSPHSQALSIEPPLQGSNVQQFGPAPTDQRGRYDFNTVGNPGPVTPIGHSDQYSSNPLQNFEALTLGGPSDPYGRNLGPSIPGGNYGSAGPSTYGNPGQLTYGQCNGQLSFNPFGNIRSNPGIFTPRGNSSFPCNDGHPGRLTYGECSGCGGSSSYGNPGRLTYGECSASHGRNRGRSKHKGINASHGRNRGRSKPRGNYRESSSSSSSSSSSNSNSRYSNSDSDDSYTDYSVILSF